MFTLSKDIQEYQRPVTVTHLGKAIYFVSQWNETLAKTEFFYNVLNTALATENDNLNWAGYQKLPFALETSLSGYNTFRIDDRPQMSDGLAVVSDAKYIYLFSTVKNRICAWRCTMVEVPDPQNEGTTTVRLQPAWEVCFKRSAKPDVPESAKDSQSFLDMSGAPFIGPTYVVPLGGNTDFEIAPGGFSVNLIPADKKENACWQFFIVNSKDKLLYTYSLKRNEDGWFLYEDQQYDNTLKVIRPDHVLSLKTKGGKKTLSFTGLPASVVYTRQENVVLQETNEVKLRSSCRVKLNVLVSGPEAENYLADIDFAVAKDGTLAFIAPGDNEIIPEEYEAGDLEPINYSLAFDTAKVQIPTGIVLGKSFVQQLWVYPQDTGLGINYLLGNSSGSKKESQPPLLWIENQNVVGFGFGDGKQFYSGHTKTGVLTLSKWNNIIAQFDGTNYSVYVNGIRVEVDDSEFSGKAPCDTKFNTLGAGNLAGDERFFYGCMDEVRIWKNARALPEALEYLYKEIPDEKAKTMANLEAYWRMDEGTGITITNFSHAGDKLNGTLSGPKWQSNTPPVTSERQEVVYTDPDTMLTLSVGVINPRNQIKKFQRFGDIMQGTKPFLFSSADGLLHLYYQGVDKKFYVAQYDCSSARALFHAPWKGRALDVANDISGYLFFSARQSGTIMNGAIISLTRENNPFLCSVELRNGTDRVEKFRGVPIHIPMLISILNGKAVSTPGNYDLSKRAVFYDYSGKRNIAYQAFGPEQHYGHLVFISNDTNDFILDTVSNTIESTRATTKLAFRIEGSPEPFIVTFPELPTQASLYRNTLEGMNTLGYEDYYDGRKTTHGDSSVYNFPNSDGYVLAFIPDPAVSNFSARITDPQSVNPFCCDLSITMKFDGTDISAEWLNIPRRVKDFILAIKQGAADKQKEIAGKLFFRTDREKATISNGAVGQQAGLRSVINLFDVYMEGEDASVGPFTCKLDKQQGTTINGHMAPLTDGSQLFIPYVATASNNGYPAVVSFGSEMTITAELVAMGENGGWMAEAPRHALEIPANAGLEVRLDHTMNAPLVFRGDLTMEGWVNKVTVTEDKGKATLPEYPRIMHANLSNDARGAQYMMGIMPSFALQFLSRSKVCIEDNSEIHDEKLFRKDDHYTVQFYLRVNLNTIPAKMDNSIYLREEIKEDGELKDGELLSLASDGTLTLTLAQCGKTTRLSSDKKLKDNTWQFITITRKGSTVTLYINKEIGKRAEIDGKSHYDNNVVVLGGNCETVSLEMQMNQFTIWLRPMEKAEIEDRYMKPTSPFAEGLMLLWGLDEFDPEGKITNAAVLSSGLFDTTVGPEGSFFWNYPGVFNRLYGAVGDVGMITSNASIPEDSWNHVAGVFHMNYGINTGGSIGSYANCRNDKSFDVVDQFSIEGWVTQAIAAKGTKQVIFSKFGKTGEDQSFEFGINTSNMPYIDVRVSGQKNVTEQERHRHIVLPQQLKAGVHYFIGVSVSITNEIVQTGNGPESQYKVSGQFVLNDEIFPISHGAYIKESISITRSRADVNIGRTCPDGSTAK